MTETPQTTSDRPNPLASAFDAKTREAWHDLVLQALKGADFDKRMVAKTRDGIRIEPIYAPDQQGQTQSPPPGSAPFTRGTNRSVEGLGWQIHQFVTEADPQAANRTLLQDLEAGTNGVVLQIESPGQPGVKITSSSDFVTALTGSYLDLAPVQLKAGVDDLKIAQLFLDALPGLGADAGTVIAHANLDPIGNWARWGGTQECFDNALNAAMDWAKSARQTAGNLRTVHVDATVAHEAGASEGQELAYMAASLVTYLKAFERHGVAIDDAFAQLSFTLASDDDIFTSLAKLRAARRIICRIAEASGVSSQTLKSLFMTARTSQRMMAKRDPWTNILRVTVACAAAAFSGVTAITVLPFTWALGQPDKFARRIARNTQIICQEESSLGRVIDPAGGSWYVESLTNDLAEAGWKRFQDIEKAGGLVEVIASGTLQQEITAVRAQRDQDIAKRIQPLTGVSEFPILGGDGVKTEPWPAPPEAPKHSGIEPLSPHRLAEAFEALRDEADRITAQNNGKPPQVFLANIGRIIDHNTRSTWMKNLLAAGGIEALTNNGFADAKEAASAFSQSGASTACICSSDQLYAQHAEECAQLLKAGGASLVLLAGKPGEQEAALNAAGVDQYVFAGLDVVATLKELLKSTS